MSSTELAARPASLPEKIEYARFLAKSHLLPPSYRDHPENLLYAYEYGELLGLHPMAAITGIHVIDGRPAISSGLMSALVRRAGHRIRVQSTGQGGDARARCQINRADDPGFTYSAEWTMDRAKEAGLLAKSNWRHYPEAMLKARAISECCRDACQEVLLGMQYTPDELGAPDDGGEIIDDGLATRANGQADLSQMSEQAKVDAGFMGRAQRVEHAGLRREIKDEQPRAERLTEPDPDDPWLTPDPAPEREPAAPQPAGKAALERLDKLTGQLDLGPDEDVRALFGWVTGEPWTATRSQVDQARKWLEDHLEQAGGDTAAATSNAWHQYNQANPQESDDGA